MKNTNIESYVNYNTNVRYPRLDGRNKVSIHDIMWSTLLKWLLESDICLRYNRIEIVGLALIKLLVVMTPYIGSVISKATNLVGCSMTMLILP